MATLIDLLVFNRAFSSSQLGHCALDIIQHLSDPHTTQNLPKIRPYPSTFLQHRLNSHHPTTPPAHHPTALPSVWLSAVGETASPLRSSVPSHHLPSAVGAATLLADTSASPESPGRIGLAWGSCMRPRDKVIMSVTKQHGGITGAVSKLLLMTIEAAQVAMSLCDQRS